MRAMGDAAGGDGQSPPWSTAFDADALARSRELWERSARTGASLAQRWGDRSLDQGEWTIDTVTADLIEVWEELTPLAGEGIELWLQAVQRTMRAGPGA
jgi:hypothetical protein